MNTALKLDIISINLYCSALTHNDLRPEELYRAVESVVPGESMRWEILPSGRFEELLDRSGRLDRFTALLDSVSERRMNFGADDVFPVICNGNREQLIAVSGFRSAVIPGIDNREVFNIYIDFPRSLLFLAGKMLAHAGDVMNAWHGETTPLHALSIIKFQLYFDGNRPENQPPELVNFPNLGLPRMKTGAQRWPANPKIPEYIGWINYWSAETCELLEFPDSTRDGRILHLSYQTPRGAWIVKLTADPLDLMRSEHIEVLQWVYQRFDKVGVRRS